MFKLILWTVFSLAFAAFSIFYMKDWIIALIALAMTAGGVAAVIYDARSR